MELADYDPLEFCEKCIQYESTIGYGLTAAEQLMEENCPKFFDICWFIYKVIKLTIFGVIHFIFFSTLSRLIIKVANKDANQVSADDDCWQAHKGKDSDNEMRNADNSGYPFSFC